VSHQDTKATPPITPQIRFRHRSTSRGCPGLAKCFAGHERFRASARAAPKYASAPRTSFLRVCRVDGAQDLAPIIRQAHLCAPRMSPARNVWSGCALASSRPTVRVRVATRGPRTHSPPASTMSALARAQLEDSRLIISCGRIYLDRNLHRQLVEARPKDPSRASGVVFAGNRTYPPDKPLRRGAPCRGFCLSFFYEIRIRRVRLDALSQIVLGCPSQGALEDTAHAVFLL